MRKTVVKLVWNAGVYKFLALVEPIPPERLILASALPGHCSWFVRSRDEHDVMARGTPVFLYCGDVPYGRAG